MAANEPRRVSGGTDTHLMLINLGADGISGKKAEDRLGKAGIGAALRLPEALVHQPLLAAQFEARARELGYTPPPDLDNVRK